MRRHWLTTPCAALLVILLWSVPALAQLGFDRPGGDYASFALRTGDPAQCAARCERDLRCRAWAFSYPLTEGANAQCWLKSRVMPRIVASCCASGVRGTGLIEPAIGPVEFGYDRYGGDYRSFEVATDVTGKTCQLVCESEQNCRAWSYVRPGYLGQSAVCYVKDRLTRPIRKPCCISGVVR